MLKSATPLSAKDFLAAASKNKICAHKTSVYRQLAVMKKEAIVKEIQFGENKRRYEIYPKSHHHHFICVDCGHVENVNAKNDLVNLERKMTQEKKVKVVNHSLEFFGFCAHCNIR